MKDLFFNMFDLYNHPLPSCVCVQTISPRNPAAKPSKTATDNAWNVQVDSLETRGT